jgi:hypothetical protein
MLIKRDLGWRVRHLSFIQRLVLRIRQAFVEQSARASTMHFQSIDSRVPKAAKR